MIWWKCALCIGMGTVHFLASSLDDIGDACNNIKSVFWSSTSSEDKSEGSPEVLKTINKTLSKPKRISKAIKSAGTAGCDLVLDMALLLGGSCGDFRTMFVGTFASCLDCNPDSHRLFDQV